MDGTSSMRWFLAVASAVAVGATNALPPGADPDFQQEALLRRDFSMPKQRLSARHEGKLENPGASSLLEEDSSTDDSVNNQASDPVASAGLSQELKALESTQQMKEALESSILRDMAKTPRNLQKDGEEKKADEAPRTRHRKEELQKSIEEDIMNKLEINDPKGALPASATEVSNAAGIYESQLGILQALKQRLASSGRVVKEAADAEENKIVDKVLKTVDDKLAKEQPMIVSSVVEEGQKGLAKDLANAIQKNREDEMKLINKSLAAIREEAQRAESDYRAHTQKDIRESLHHFGSNITSLLQGFIRKEHEESLEQKGTREEDEYYDDDEDDDRNYRDDDDYDDNRRSSKRKSDYRSEAQQISESSQTSKVPSDTRYGVPGASDTQNEPMRRMQGKKARVAYRHHSSDDFEADALAQADATEAKALGNKLPEKEERLGSPALPETVNLDNNQDASPALHTAEFQTRTDDDFGLKEVEDTVSKEVLHALSEQKAWPGSARQHHFHRQRHHHQDDYDDDDY